MNNQNPLSIEITVLSAEGLKTTSIFSHRIRPFITLSTVPPKSSNGNKHGHVYKTRVIDDHHDHSGPNPTWGDKLSLPIDTNFFTNGFSGVYVHLYTKRLILGRAQLGWCLVPAHDIGLQPVGSARFLSYRLRDRDGFRTRGIVNLSVRLEGFEPLVGGSSVVPRSLPTCHTVIGIPVGSYSNISELSSSTCQVGRFRC